MKQILLLIMKSGVVFPVALPGLEDPWSELVGLDDGVEENDGWLYVKHAQSGDDMRIRWSDVIAVQLTDEGNLQRKVLTPGTGRIQ